VNPPRVLVHVAFAWQRALPISHSSMSAQVEPSPATSSEPAGHVQIARPVLSSHVATGSHTAESQDRAASRCASPAAAPSVGGGATDPSAGRPPAPTGAPIALGSRSNVHADAPTTTATSALARSAPMPPLAFKVIPMRTYPPICCLPTVLVAPLHARRCRI
jgi:hypothetical protein